MNSIIMNFDDNADINVIFNQLKRLYPNVRIIKNNIDIEEVLEDKYLLVLSEERIKSDNGIRYSFDEILAERGLTVKDIDNMEDVELEYELPG